MKLNIQGESFSLDPACLTIGFVSNASAWVEVDFSLWNSPDEARLKERTLHGDTRFMLTGPHTPKTIKDIWEKQAHCFTHSFTDYRVLWQIQSAKEA